MASYRELHIESRTYGEENTKQLAQIDSTGLFIAAGKDASMFRESALKYEINTESIEIAIWNLHELNRKSGLYK